ncbi:TIGR04222 domain-containing membrane protein [Streptomyces sp. NBC_01294]|uniref:TIGR04222 domain-containing membrane protein n=1 Tax=Streptomyces sp. NBC_01294 TaxID=2903815 RepID=UPI003FA39D2D
MSCCSRVRPGPCRTQPAGGLPATTRCAAAGDSSCRRPHGQPAYRRVPHRSRHDNPGIAARTESEDPGGGEGSTSSGCSATLGVLPPARTEGTDMNGLGPWIFALTYVAAAGLMAHVIVASRRARHPRPSAPAARAAPALGNALFEAAFLAGGPRRVAHTVLVAMQRDGRLHISRDGNVTRVPGAPRNAVEGQFVGALGRGGVVTAERLCRLVMRSRAVRDIGTTLVRAGLLVEPTVLARIVRRRRIVAALLPVLVVSGFPAAGDHTARALTPAGLLVLLSIAVIVFLVRTSKRRLWCTTAGAERLASLRRAPSAALPGTEPVLAGVALLGVGQLSDPELEAAVVGHGRSDRGGSGEAGAACGGGEAGGCGGGGDCGGD